MIIAVCSGFVYDLIDQMPILHHLHLNSRKPFCQTSKGNQDRAHEISDENIVT